jgi:putative CocE/NonD family hydrolase
LNNGGLTFDPPHPAEHADSFAYDPNDPMPGLRFYPTLGPVDHRHLEGRMLTYTSAELKQDLTIIGPVKAILHGLSSAPDTDWVVRLCDVCPDGRSMPVCDGILRARFRNSLQRPELMTPGRIYRFEIDMSATAQVFLSGHRLRIEVTSSDFPRYDRNLNTGGPFGEEAIGQIAVNTVFHDANRPSHVVLPVMED